LMSKGDAFLDKSKAVRTLDVVAASCVDSLIEENAF
jgi:hypothetical protein